MAVDWNAPLRELGTAANDAYYSREREPLINAPESGLERCWQALQENATEEAAGLALMNVFRSRWEDGLSQDRECWDALIDLKHLIDVGLCASAKYVEKARYTLENSIDVFFRRARHQKGVPDSLVDQNPMTAIERCFYGPDADTREHRIGALLMATFRPIAFDMDVFLGAAFAFREAHGFFTGRNREAALDSLEWAEDIVQEIQDQLPDQSLYGVGQMYDAVAGGAKAGEFYDDLPELLDRALVYLPKSGDIRGCCLVQKALESKRRRQFDEALHWLNEAEQVADLEPDTQSLIGIQSREIRAMLHGDTAPENMMIPDEAFESVGAPTRYPRAMQAVAAKVLKGEQPTDTEQIATFEAAPEYFQAMQTGDNKPRSEIFGEYVVLMKSAASLIDPENRSRWFAEMKSCADQYLPDAAVAAKTEYDILLADVL